MDVPLRLTVKIFQKNFAKTLDKLKTRCYNRGITNDGGGENPPRKEQKMEVKTYCINKGSASEYYGLICVDTDGSEWVMRSVPNNWKTEKGALRYAEKHGYKIVK